MSAPPVGQFPYRLGKKRPVVDQRTLKLTAYLAPDLPPAPPAVDSRAGITTWGMFANDHLGDCTCAAAAHMEMIWSALKGTPTTLTDADVIDMYGRVNGGHDDGAVELFVLREWRDNGIAGHKLKAFAQIDHRNIDRVKQAAYLFSGVYIGIALPVAFQGQPAWDCAYPVGADRPPAWAAGSWGGHAVDVAAYDPAGVTLITWGKEQRMTWNAWLNYVEEAYVAVPIDYAVLPASGVVDFAQLDADLQAVSTPNATPAS